MGTERIFYLEVPESRSPMRFSLIPREVKFHDMFDESAAVPSTGTPRSMTRAKQPGP